MPNARWKTSSRIPPSPLGFNVLSQRILKAAQSGFAGFWVISEQVRAVRFQLPQECLNVFLGHVFTAALADPIQGNSQQCFPCCRLLHRDSSNLICRYSRNEVRRLAPQTH
ncbi:hypothetical protein [Synechococcus sp. Minos11]|uniref:hypothetical protein n=1 Tax=Synechococcus sp. Minos11 TaxID=221341 RepID=UPI001647CB88|nr:hypothetical protein [Synechococcus sp. Minos11]